MKTWTTKNGQQVTQVLDGRCNIFMVSGGTGNMLIDTGSAGMRRKLVSRLKRADLTKPAGIVLTHAHFDHAGGAALLREMFGCPVYVHRSEAELLKRGANPVIRGATTFGAIGAFMASIAPERLLAYPPCPPDVFVEDRLDLFDLGADTYILHTPGHTRGSMSVIVGGEIAVVGDTLFGMCRSSAFPPFAEDQRELTESWRRLLDTGCRIFLPAHGGVKTAGELRAEYERRGGTGSVAD
ncbi:MAG TPA: MBL fold metallo-hydrolase [Smithellaceae bacterium]|nr:MBL fold metallo-hydrolase [Smithellaceae bacterium]HPL96163.1 MBL fold metallo-hydrolase [Smithellaceae bacterium]HQF85177.1 MBL fold metallo-hydrolase [Smithellaceae bacterium]HQG81341.1 MBL fold metallo-hydrolase [Smithellaceae bacterium]